MMFGASVSVIALVGVTAVGAPFTSASSASSASSATVANPPAGCRIADDSDLRRAGAETATGHYVHEQWMVNDAAQRALERIGSALALRFGESSKSGPTQLDAGFIGLSFDHNARTVVAVLDADSVLPKVVGAELRAAALGALPVHV